MKNQIIFLILLSLCAYSCCEDDEYLGKLFIHEESKKMLPNVLDESEFIFNDSLPLILEKIIVFDTTSTAEANRLSDCGLLNYVNEYYESERIIYKSISKDSSISLLISLDSRLEYTNELGNTDTLVPQSEFNIYDHLSIEFNSDDIDSYFGINLHDHQNMVNLYPSKFEIINDTMIGANSYNQIFKAKSLGDTLYYSSDLGVIQIKQFDGGKVTRIK